MAAETSGFFNADYDVDSGVWDRTYTAEQFAKYFSRFIGNGVFAGILSELQVRQHSDEETAMDVRLTSGSAYINGFWYELVRDMYFNVEPNTDIDVPVRTDCICIQYNYNAREIKAVYHEGVSTPTRDGYVYELMLCTISVPYGITYISDVEITDTRMLDDYCGIVTGLVEQISFDDIHTQFTAWFYHYVQSQTGSFESWMSNQKAIFELWQQTEKDGFYSWQQAEENGFNSWFANLRNELDDNQAAHLQNEIDALTEKEFKHFNELYNAVTSFDKDENGDVIAIHTTNNEGVSDTVINKDSEGNITSIVTTLVPDEGNWKYIKTATFTDNQVNKTYEREGKS